MRTTNVKVEKNKEEPAVSLLKRFQRKVQESGVLPRVRSIRYNERGLSDLKTKLAKLKRGRHSPYSTVFDLRFAALSHWKAYL